MPLSNFRFNAYIIVYVARARVAVGVELEAGARRVMGVGVRACPPCAIYMYRYHGVVTPFFKTPPPSAAGNRRAESGFIKKNRQKARKDCERSSKSIVKEGHGRRKDSERSSKKPQACQNVRVPCAQ